MEHSYDVMDAALTAYLDRSVRERPEAVAITDRRRRISYAELDEISNCVASVLTSRGPALDQRIGIWLNKSVEAVAAIHAVLRSGGAYVPVDPTAPPRRAAAMLADCGASWLITTSERACALAACAPEVLNPLSLMCVGDDLADPPDLPVAPAAYWEDALARYAGADRVSAPTASSDVAYLLYTSGSTGTPKGVVLTHGNARAFVDWAVQELALTPDDVLAGHAPLHFDLSILDVFGAAACGGRVALVPESVQGIGPALVRFVADHGVSVWYSVPTALRRMAESADREALAGSRVRVVAFAGEEYPVRHLRSLTEVLPADAALYNLYGPTETNVCTFHRLTAADLADGTSAAPPIGRACPYATTLLLSEHGTVLPGTGDATGELCVGGGSTMRGYWNDPERTAESTFEADGTRFYRTGDTVRRRDDGSFVFVGRNDSMVKIKGQRVELGEIEAVLDGGPDVAGAACVVARGRTGSARIVAFVTAVPGARLDERRLRRRCREFLPGYMVPERIEVASELAFTSTGKLDRRALAQRAEREAESGSGSSERPGAVARVE